MRRHWGSTSVAVGAGMALIGGILVQASPALADPAPTAPTQQTNRACASPDQSEEFQHGPLVSRMEVTGTSADCLRTYAMDSGVMDSDVDRTFTERADRPLLRTGSSMLDGLYAMAMQEEKQLSVNSVSNGDYNGGAPMNCTADGTGCYITGKNWTYVWTRDLSYASDLGLAAVDPLRARNSLDFKLSQRRDTTTEAGADLQILQDTGTGGSYPNSSDRVTWAIGATETIPWLPDGEREEFAQRAYEAIHNTIEHDRQVVFDATTGLYSGETSFLDWRQQTYPAWTAKDVTQITTSESLSTNVTHWVAIDAAATLAESAGKSEEASRYHAWADSLKAAIREKFWLADRGQFSQVLSNTLNQAPTERYDALATALAVITGVATDEQAASAVATYPQSPYGPSVIWPQQQEDERSYHNKGVWPFVTAYMLRAAAHVGNDQAAMQQMEDLLRTPALFGTNYENMNIMTGAADTALNSERQTWSVAGMLGMFQEVLFGVEATQDGLTISPFVPAQFRQKYFPTSTEVSLDRMDFRGHQVDVVLDLPQGETAGQGAYTVTGMSVDGVEHDPATPITPDQLQDHSVVRVQLGAPAPTVQGPTVVNTYDAGGDDWLEPYAGDQAVFGPRTPKIEGAPTLTGEGNALTLSIDFSGEAADDLSMDIIRDGKIIAQNLSASTTWTDQDAPDPQCFSSCYSVRTHYESGNTSQDADPVCYWGEGFDRITKMEAKDFTVEGGKPNASGEDLTHYMDWGSKDSDSITTEFTPEVTGTYLFQTDYALGRDIRSGVSSGIKRLTVTEKGQGGAEAGNGLIFMPNTDSWTVENGSTLVPAHLRAGTTYTISLTNDRYTANMSYFQANATYSNEGAGNTTGGAANLTDIFRIKAMLRHADVDQIAVSVDSASQSEAELGQDVTVTSTVSGEGLVEQDVEQGVTIDWGDGTPVQSLRDVTVAGAGFTATNTHTYAGTGTYTVTVTGRDATGETTATHTVVVRGATTLTTAPGQPDGTARWYITAPVATLALPDAPESDGAQLQYRLDGSQEWVAYSTPVTLPDGAHSVEYRSLGAGGRAGVTRSADLKVDTVAPEVSASVEDGETTAQVTLTPSDATSGVERAEYRLADADVWTTYEGVATLPRVHAQQTLQYRALDKAGNTSATGSLTIAALPDPGTPTGTFAVTKTLVDDAGLVPEGTTFRVDYYVDGSQSPSGTLVVTDGATVEGPEGLAAGTTVSFSEEPPADVVGGTWKDAVIDPGELTIEADTTSQVQVTNEIAQNLGRFSVEKQVEGADASGVAFTFTFTPAGGDTQEFTVEAGQAWTSDPLPQGTVVTVSEKKAPGIKDRSYAGVTFTGRGVTPGDDGQQATVTIGNDTTTVLTATNTYETREGLAITGAQAAGLAGLALVLMAGGSALVLARRRGQQA